jgi:hypothetical protein
MESSGWAGSVALRKWVGGEKAEIRIALPGAAGVVRFNYEPDYWSR